MKNFGSPRVQWALLAALLLVVLVLPWQLARYGWTGLLLGAYLSVAAFSMPFAALIAVQSPWSRSEDLVFAIHSAAARAEEGWSTRVRRVVAVTLFNLAASLAWPVSPPRAWVRFARIRRARSISLPMALWADQALHSDIVGISASMAVFAVTGSLAAHGLAMPEPVGAIFFSVIALYAILGLLACVAGPMPLPTELRRGPGNPYPRFLLVVGSFFIILVLSFAGMRHGAHGVDTPRLMETASDLLTFRKGWFERRAVRLDYALLVASLLYYSVLIQAVFRWSEFRRTDEDVHAIAAAYLALGNFERSLWWLERVKLNNINTYWGFACADLGLGRMDAALEAARKMAVLYRPGERILTDGHQALAGLCLYYPIPRPTLLHVYRCLIENGAHDSSLAMLLTRALDARRLYAGDVDALLAGQRQRHPLAYVGNLLRKEEFAEAREILETLRAGSALDEAVQQLFLLQANVGLTGTKEEARVCLTTWLERSLPQLTALVDLLEDDYERVQLYIALRMLSDRAHDFAPCDEQSLRLLVERLRASITSPETQRFGMMLTR